EEAGHSHRKRPMRRRALGKSRPAVPVACPGCRIGPGTSLHPPVKVSYSEPLEPPDDPEPFDSVAAAFSDLLSDFPSLLPSDDPSDFPSDLPSDFPSGLPSDFPSDFPSGPPFLPP